LLSAFCLVKIANSCPYWSSALEAFTGIAP